ncbi:MAG TPA: ribosome-recycling factor [bacterium]|nr:ribosome-recycling factor [bacterium]
MNNIELKTRLDKSIEFLQSELKQIRAGRVSPALVADISVEAYSGSMMTIKELGSIIVMDPSNLSITPWDKSVLDAIVNGVRNSGQGLSAVKEADRVRVNVPALTEERRIEFTKDVSEKVENCKNSIRSIRQEAMKDIEKDFSDKAISEDDKFRLKEDVEKTIKEFIEIADDIGAEKKNELMTI